MNSSFYKVNQIQKKLTILEKNYQVIIKELLSSEKTWVDWPEKSLYSGENWKIIPIFAFGKWVPKFKPLFPKLQELVSKVPGIETLLFSRIMPGTTLTPHQGWASLSNRILRCHLTLKAKENNYLAVIDDQQVEKKKYHKEGKIIIFDDSKTHYSANLSDETRIVLIIDVKRPEFVKPGESEAEDTPELISIIEQMLKLE